VARSKPPSRNSKTAFPEAPPSFACQLVPLIYRQSTCGRPARTVTLGSPASPAHHHLCDRHWRPHIACGRRRRADQIHHRTGRRTRVQSQRSRSRRLSERRNGVALEDTSDVTEPCPISARHRPNAAMAWRRAQVWVRSRTAGWWDESSAIGKVSELDAQRILGTPDNPARSTVADGRAQPELIGDRVGSDPRNLRPGHSRCRPVCRDAPGAGPHRRS
jgi:hypothetical protein